MRTFYKLLVSALLVLTTNNFIWFAVTFFVFLETRSVAATGIIAGIYLVATAATGFWLGSFVDHNQKKTVMIGSSLVSLAFYGIGYLIYQYVLSVSGISTVNPWLWAFVIVLICGVVAGNIYNIAIPTLIGILVPEDKHDKANGLFGSVSGVGFALTSVASGMVLGFAGMWWVLVLAVFFTVLAIIYLKFIPISEKKIAHAAGQSGQLNAEKKVDIRGTIKVINNIPGMFGLIFFNIFNNFLGGVFMSLMDAYGLSLVPVQVWGLIIGFLSFGFIAGGLIIAKIGLGKNPVETLFKINLITWTVCIFFTLQPWIFLLISGMAIWMILTPFIEASEQTIFQKVVPKERMGRVFGFSQSIEQAASPLTAFFIGPVTQIIFIPFMTSGSGVKLIGDWFGVGPGRGIALVFTISGIIGFLVTVLAMRSKSYKLLADKYLEK